MSDRRDRDRAMRDRDRERERIRREEEEERRAETERRGEQLKEAWRRRHPEREEGVVRSLRLMVNASRVDCEFPAYVSGGAVLGAPSVYYGSLFGDGRHSGRADSFLPVLSPKAVRTLHTMRHPRGDAS